MKVCAHCGKILPPKKRKFCSDHCSYWFHAIARDTPHKASKAQHLRMLRAGRAQAKGKIGVRYN